MSDNNFIIPAEENNSLPFVVDDYEGINLTPAARKKLSSIISASRTGLVSASPLICKGPVDCPFKSRCPIYTSDGSSGTYPLERQCIVEVTLINDRYLAYMEELDAHGKASESMTYRSQISALVDLDLREFRTTMLLAGAGGYSDGTMLLEQTIALNEEGEEVKQLQEHPAWRNLVRIRKERMELLDAMGLTVKRDAMIKAALKQKDADNFLTKSIELLERIADLEEATNRK